MVLDADEEKVVTICTEKIAASAFFEYISLHYGIFKIYFMEASIVFGQHLKTQPRLGGARWRGWLARSAAIVEVKQIFIGWVTKNLPSPVPPCFGRHVKPLVPDESAVVSTRQSTLRPRARVPSRRIVWCRAWPFVFNFHLAEYSVKWAHNSCLQVLKIVLKLNAVSCLIN
ncbi:hypothetical protein evm_000840 [Chilo suppressalis]|nr:hypothetical protein evm_000840 [Chilo suppressalis]